MQIKFSSPPTTKTTQVEAKSVEQPTYRQLLNYRKSALAANLDKYPNGYLVISSIGIRLPIYNRANDRTLSLGVAKDYFLDSEMGKGNFVLAGHNMLRRHVLLSDLNKVKLGADMVISDNEHAYHYTIKSKKVVSPYVMVANGSGVAKDSPYYLPKVDEKALLTIYTCSNNGKKRLVIQGELTTID